MYKFNVGLDTRRCRESASGTEIYSVSRKDSVNNPCGEPTDPTQTIQYQDRTSEEPESAMIRDLEETLVVFEEDKYTTVPDLERKLAILEEEESATVGPQHCSRVIKHHSTLNNNIAAVLSSMTAPSTQIPITLKYPVAFSLVNIEA